MASADAIRFATFDTGLGRKGPGLMLRDLRSGKNDQAEAALSIIVAADADVLMLMDVDWDYDGAGLDAVVQRLAGAGLTYGHTVELPPNSGVPSGVDLDGDGTTYEARDALGYGWFLGDSGMAVLSRYPFGAVEDLSHTLWSDISEASNVLPPDARAVVPLATTAQWVIPLRIGAEEITLITLSAGTPVFDGPEDRNGLRNRDELAFVANLVDAARRPLVMGRANQDPARGEGHAEALHCLLEHPALQDPRPLSDDGSPATVEWRTAGRMRVDYVLPPRSLRVLGSGVLHDPDAGSSRLVWVEVAVP
ncbi:Endonuclease/Exonuclease/phosphatase family protein [Jannaschia faecimaris]|uniref:Endonuclease/Exonuclease/phosphatase family protein n=1 Tax=Jannaschia faecimaris TaxID=1244108 RepID=A0A1H3JK28_9RHOB|nr:endonuclease/exonuclease/phosphatase family protein [Jannaschia faecimaris]SDY40282.1 Endonuclease/Exonuclease/phosphatase family protein [Jannaschia faecimaris]